MAERNAVDDQRSYFEQHWRVRQSTGRHGKDSMADADRPFGRPRIKLSETKRIRVEFNALNLFNQKTARNRFFTLNRGAGVDEEQSAINLNNLNLFNGYDYRVLLNGTQDQTSGYVGLTILVTGFRIYSTPVSLAGWE